ncbi:MAG: hypothetical protein ABIR56_07490 [Polaromonas sp.]
MIVSLKKSTVGGLLYTRLPEIEARLVALSMLSESVLVVLCGQSKSHSQYVPSECLLYFVRRSASTNPALFDRLFRLLSERILMKLPRAENAGGETVSLTNSDIREAVYTRAKLLHRTSLIQSPTAAWLPSPTAASWPQAVL